MRRGRIRSRCIAEINRELNRTAALPEGMPLFDPAETGEKASWEDGDGVPGKLRLNQGVPEELGRRAAGIYQGECRTFAGGSIVPCKSGSSF